MTLIGHWGLYASMNYTSFYETKQQNSKFRLHYVLLIFQAQQNQILINKLQLKSQISIFTFLRFLTAAKQRCKLSIGQNHPPFYLYPQISSQTNSNHTGKLEKNFKKLKKKLTVVLLDIFSSPLTVPSPIGDTSAPLSVGPALRRVTHDLDPKKPV